MVKWFALVCIVHLVAFEQCCGFSCTYDKECIRFRSDVNARCCDDNQCYTEAQSCPHGLSTGGIVGIVAAVIVVALIVIVAMAYYCKCCGVGTQGEIQPPYQNLDETNSTNTTNQIPLHQAPQQPPQPYVQPQPQQPYVQPQPQKPYVQPQPQKPYVQPQPQQPYVLLPQPQQPYVQPQPQVYVQLQPQQLYGEPQPQQLYGQPQQLQLYRHHQLPEQDLSAQPPPYQEISGQTLT